MATQFDMELEEFQSLGDGVLVDIRKQDDYEAGHIPGALNISVENLRDEIRQVARFNTPILVYCYTGNKSQQMEAQLKTRGYENTRSIGGIDQYTGPMEPALTVRQMRIRKKLSQSELARTVGIRQPTVAAYESGKANPGPDICAKIRQIYGVTIAPMEKNRDGRKGKNAKAAERRGAGKSGKSTSIRDLRKSLNLTQAVLAESIGVGTGTVAAYEAGRISPSAEVIEKLKNLYGLELTRPERKERKKKQEQKNEKTTRRGAPVFIRIADERIVSLDEIRKKVDRIAGKVEAIHIRISNGRIIWYKPDGDTGSMELE